MEGDIAAAEICIENIKKGWEQDGLKLSKQLLSARCVSIESLRQQLGPDRAIHNELMGLPPTCKPPVSTEDVWLGRIEFESFANCHPPLNVVRRNSRCGIRNIQVAYDTCYARAVDLAWNVAVRERHNELSFTTDVVSRDAGMAILQLEGSTGVVIPRKIKTFRSLLECFRPFVPDTPKYGYGISVTTPTKNAVIKMMADEPNSGNYDSVTPKTKDDMIKKEVENKESTAKQEARTNGSGGGERCQTSEERLLDTEGGDVADSEGGKVAGSVAGKNITEHERISKSSLLWLTILFLLFFLQSRWRMTLHQKSQISSCR